MTKPKIVITDWDQMLHKFTDGRKVLWLKLYISLLSDRRWRRLGGDAAKLYTDLLMLAATEKPYGTIDMMPEEVAWELRTTLPEIQKDLIEVAQSGLITVMGYSFDVKMISSGDQDEGEVSSTRSQDDASRGEDILRVRGETTIDQPTSSKGWSPDVVHVDLEELALFCRDFDIPYSEMNETLRKLHSTELIAE